MERILISDYNGRSISNLGNIDFDPKGKRIIELSNWFKSTKSTVTSKKGFPDLSYDIINDVTIDTVSKGRNIFLIKRRINYVKFSQKYKACKICRKKLLVLDELIFRCEKCKKQTNEFMYRTICNICICDETGSLWITIFPEKLENLLNLKLNDDFFYNDNNLEKCVQDLLNKDILYLHLILLYKLTKEKKF